MTENAASVNAARAGSRGGQSRRARNRRMPMSMHSDLSVVVADLLCSLKANSNKERGAEMILSNMVNPDRIIRRLALSHR